MEPKSAIVAQPDGVSSKKNVGAGGGGNKPKKKTSKFLKNRVGDTSLPHCPMLVYFVIFRYGKKDRMTSIFGSPESNQLPQEAMNSAMAISDAEPLNGYSLVTIAALASESKVSS
ncbi:hypothetical protein Peur_012208 [Populus x canadensis]